jgi:hypothetical protein
MLMPMASHDWKCALPVAGTVALIGAICIMLIAM